MTVVARGTVGGFRIHATGRDLRGQTDASARSRLTIGGNRRETPLPNRSSTGGSDAGAEGAFWPALGGALAQISTSVARHLFVYPLADSYRRR
ncbi:hypothetical protein K4L06_18130 [Lysobacter sp. BMK333-48F3]|uniref:hypothetical protein n=1 Tax=Lysobacter sp. BMK333-48F3 TaxID=2867962 RepID=UPI001C8BADD8|nr:hypothetical protein [Lysobacter sp. BMK333-48F3]MBX9403233.1 hypothetical protein [Lysobacter sp. BMK333-48F3]